MNVHKRQQTRTALLMATLLGSGCIISTPSLAQIKPRAMHTDSRIKVVAYQANNVTQIYAMPLVSTKITFAPYERILQIASGDSAAWMAIKSEVLPNVFFLKPTMIDSKTNLTVITDQRTYYFDVTSLPPNSRHTANYAINFIYPAEKARQLAAKQAFEKGQHDAVLSPMTHPQHYNWDYNYSGTNSIMPLHVFDDGKFTYFQLRDHHAVPAIFAVDNEKGEESVVNYRRNGEYLVVQRISPQFTLRAGKDKVASIFNHRLIAKMRKYGTS